MKTKTKDYVRGTIIERRLIPALFVLNELDNHSDTEIGESLVKIIESDKIFEERFLKLVEKTEDRVWNEMCKIRRRLNNHKKK